MTGGALPFGRFAADYDANRPSYPSAAIEWLLEGISGQVLDLGAGSGKLTRLLSDRCSSVRAIEPDRDMLALLKRQLPDVLAEHGSAEHLPVPAGTIHLVLVAQAWHWFDAASALLEVKRVLVPGGRLGVLWNAPSSKPPWQRALAAAVPAVSPVHETWWPRGFPRTRTETQVYYWTQWMTPDELAREYATHIAVRKAGGHLAEITRIAEAEAMRLGSARVPYERMTWCARRVGRWPSEEPS